MLWFKDVLAGVGLMVFFASSLLLAGATQSLLIAG
jgi:hypothetical protein